MSDAALVRALLDFAQEAEELTKNGKASVAEDAFESWVTRVQPVLDEHWIATACYFESLMRKIRHEQAPNRGRQKAQLSLQSARLVLLELATGVECRR